MSALRPFRRPWLWAGLWALMFAAVAAGSLMPASGVPGWAFPGGDKVQHLLGYAALSGYAVMLFRSRPAQRLAAVAVVLFGVGIEAAQGLLTATRSADGLDVVANAVGALLGQWLHGRRMAGLLERADALFRET